MIQLNTHQTLHGFKQSPHKYLIHSLDTLIDRELHEQCICQDAARVIKLTTPFHFPVSIGVYSSAVKLVIFGSRFPPESILQRKRKWHRHCMSTDCHTHQSNRIACHRWHNPSVLHTTLVALSLIADMRTVPERHFLQALFSLLLLLLHICGVASLSGTVILDIHLKYLKSMGKTYMLTLFILKNAKWDDFL